MAVFEWGKTQIAVYESGFQLRPFSSFMCNSERVALTGGSVMEHAEVTAGKVQCLS